MPCAWPYTKTLTGVIELKLQIPRGRGMTDTLTTSGDTKVARGNWLTQIVTVSRWWRRGLNLQGCVPLSSGFRVLPTCSDSSHPPPSSVRGSGRPGCSLARPCCFEDHRRCLLSSLGTHDTQAGEAQGTAHAGGPMMHPTDAVTCPCDPQPALKQEADCRGR